MATPLKFKLKQVPTDVWSLREKLCLANSVMRSGDQNWVSVSRAIKNFGEPNRPADWFSQKNCALQYSDLLEKVETTKRKRGEREIETPGESIVKKLIQERIEELQAITAGQRQKYKKLKLECEQIRSGQCDDKLQEIWQQTLDEKKKEEEEKEKHAKWLQDRETRQAALASLKPAKIPAIPINKQKKVNRNFRHRQSGVLSDQGSEPESVVDSPVDETPKPEPIPEIAPTSPPIPKPTPITPTSPLLTSLLKNPNPVTGFSTLQSTISPQKISPPSTVTTTSAILTPEKESPIIENDLPPKPTHVSPSAGAPTLSRLLELPWTSPGKPLPPINVDSPEEDVVEMSETTIKSPLSVKSPVVVEDEKTSDILEMEASPDVDEVKIVKDEPEVVEEILETVVEKTEDAKTMSEVELDVEVVETVSEVVTYEEGEDVQTNVEIQEESEIEVVSVVEEKVEEGDKVDRVEEEVVGEEEVVVEEESVVGDVKNEPAEVKEDVAEVKKIEDETREASPVNENVSKEVEEEKIEDVVNVASPPVKTPTEGSRASRGKRGRTTRRQGSLRNSQSLSSVVEETEKLDTKKESKEIKEKVDDEPKTQLKVKEEEENQIKSSKEKTRGKKVAKVDNTLTKKKEEAKESSDDSSESKTMTRKRKSSSTSREQRWRNRKHSEMSRSKLRRPPSPEVVETPKVSRSRKGKEEVSLPTTSEDDDDKSLIGKGELIALGKSFLPTDSVPNSPSSLSQSDDPDNLRDYKLWKKAIMLVWRSAANHKYANVFLHPVTDDVAPGYSSVVYRSMDLSQIKKSIESGAIKTTSEFQRDMMLMFQNAIMYNGSDHDVFHMAVGMQKEVESHIQDFRATQLMVQTTEAPKNLRRETRELSQKRTSSEYRERTDDYKRLGSDVDGSKVKKRRTRATDD